MKMKINYFLLIFLTFAVCSCWKQGPAAKDMEITSRSEGISAISLCINKDQTSRIACRPNIHRFFSRPDDFYGVKVNVVAYAVYGAQGGLLIYPSIDSACNRLEYSAIKIVHSHNLPPDISRRLESSGVVRVEVVGRVLDNGADGGGGIPVVGSVVADFLRAIEAPKTILLKDPRGLDKQNFDAGFFGEIKQESCG